MSAAAHRVYLAHDEIRAAYKALTDDQQDTDAGVDVARNLFPVLEDFDERAGRSRRDPTDAELTVIHHHPHMGGGLSAGECLTRNARQDGALT